MATTFYVQHDLETQRFPIVTRSAGGLSEGVRISLHENLYVLDAEAEDAGANPLTFPLYSECGEITSLFMLSGRDAGRGSYLDRIRAEARRDSE